MRSLSIAAAALVTIAALSGCAPAAEDPDASFESTAPEVEEVAEPGPGDAILSNPGRVSPEEIAAMTPEDLRSFVTITVEEAPTPDAYAQEYIKVYDAWMNSGTTEAEFAPYKDQAKGVFEAALGEKYDATFKNGLYAEGLGVDGAVNIHNSVLNGALVPLTLNTDIPFSFGTVYSSSELLTDSPDTQGEFSLIVNADIADNSEESGLSQFTHEKNVLNTASWELTVANFDGVLKVTSVKTL